MKINQNAKIVSYASQNPERQRELTEAIAQVSNGHVKVQFANTEDEAQTLVSDADILLAHRLTPNLYGAGPKLSWVHLSSAGVDHSLFDPFTESEVVLTNSRGLHARPMAEWVLGALLYWAQRLDIAEEWRRTHEWKEPKKRMTEQRRILAGMTALVVGYGEVGKGIADSLLAAGLKVEAVASSERSGKLHVYSIEQLEERLEQNEIVVLTLPLTKQSRGLFNRRLFPLMKEGSVFVNVARGAIVDEADLVAALKSGKPAYALLDVFATEPLSPDSELFNLTNVYMTPHVSGNFPDYTRMVHDIFIENLTHYLNGSPMRFVVDKKRGY